LSGDGGCHVLVLGDAALSPLVLSVVGVISITVVLLHAPGPIALVLTLRALLLLDFLVDGDLSLCALETDVLMLIVLVVVHVGPVLVVLLDCDGFCHLIIEYYIFNIS